MSHTLPHPPAPPLPDDAQLIAATRAWVDHAVIGLNLCPFAKAVQVKGLVRYAVSHADEPAALLSDLSDELMRLAGTPADAIETTVLVHPRVLQDFADFNDFLPLTDRLLKRMKLRGLIQVASFHPQYRFEGTEADDITNATNRSPWPTLHLIREASIDRAVAAFPEAEAIFETNMATLRKLGPQGWQALQAQWLAEAAG